MMAWLWAAGAALAADGDAEKPKISVGGVLFPRYSYDLTEGGEGFNEFAVDRSYVFVKAELGKVFGARVTLDADRIKPVDVPLPPVGTATEAEPVTVTVDTKLRVFVKHAYLEAKSDSAHLKLRAGIIDTPYGPYYDSFVGMRYVGDSFAANTKIISTADFGIGGMGTQGKGKLDWAVQVVNGEGYAKPEADAGKQLAARISVDPLAGGDKKVNLPITGYFSLNGQPSADQPTITFGGAVGFKHPNFVGWGEILAVQTDVTAVGWSTTLMPRIDKVGGLYVRFDSYDPDGSADDDATSTLRVGPAHDFYDKVSLAATYELVLTQGSDTPGQALVAHAQVGF